MHTNEQIALEALPKVEAVTLQRLPNRYKYTQILSRIVICLGALVVAYLLARQNPNVAQALPRIQWPLLVAGLLWILYPLAAHRFRGYAVREKDLIYEHGLIWRKSSAIAFNRVQHIEIEQDLVGRWASLASIELYTAGGKAGDLTIPGLDKNDAATLREFILSQANHA